MLRRGGRACNSIAGERLFRAIRDYTDWQAIEAIVIETDDRGARRLSAAESILLPKPLEWRSFYRHDLNLIVDTPPEVKAVSVKQQLGKSQTRAPGKLNSVSKDQFEEFVRESQGSRKKGQVTTVPSCLPQVWVVGGTPALQKSRML